MNSENKNNNIFNKININLNNSDIKSKSNNKNNFYLSYDKNENHEENNKFMIPSSIMDLNDYEEGESSKNNAELLNKKELLPKNKNHNKKNKSNKNKKANQSSNFIINLDEKDE